jgi:HSP20 family protein
VDAQAYPPYEFKEIVMAKEEKMANDSAKQGKPVGITRRTGPLSPFRDEERWFESFFPRGWMRPFHMDWPSFHDFPVNFEERMPKVDVIDRDAEVVVRAEVPGVEKDDLDITMTDHTVTIKGKTKHEEKEEKGDYYRCEISSGSFARTLALPSDVDTDKAEASFKDGVLELKLPKVAKAKRRSIKIG